VRTGIFRSSLTDKLQRREIFGQGAKNTYDDHVNSRLH
jgi:hypothetical protein